MGRSGGPGQGAGHKAQADRDREMSGCSHENFLPECSSGPEQVQQPRGLLGQRGASGGEVFAGVDLGGVVGEVGVTDPGGAVQDQRYGYCGAEPGDEVEVQCGRALQKGG
ncbi:hypothetical protein GCM10010103_49110 [Streptomyces paradoxus]